MEGTPRTLVKSQPELEEIVASKASIGEVCHAMRDVFGSHNGGAF